MVTLSHIKITLEQQKYFNLIYLKKKNTITHFFQNFIQSPDFSYRYIIQLYLANY